MLRYSLFSLFFLVFTSCLGLEPNPNPYLNQFSTLEEIPMGGNVFQTKGELKEEINAEGVQTWRSHQSEFAVFFRAQTSVPVEISLEVLNQSGTSQLEVEVNGKKLGVALKAGDNGLIRVGIVDLVEGYNQVNLSGVQKSGTDYAKIKSLWVGHSDDLQLDYVKDNIDSRFYWGRRGPSVHLSYAVLVDKNFKWFYNEITIPEGEDPIGSYFMANGFGEGYFGIQVNSPTERRVLFSVWSPYATDNPNAIPEDQKIKLLKKGDEVYTGEFGNEGSGGQSFLRFPWKAGTTYRFLNSVEPDGNGNTIYTAYFFAPEVGDWMLIASFLRPKTDTWYRQPHSFLENFIPESGHLTRLVKYTNQWMADQDGNWFELREAKFTGDDIARRGYRKDFDGGQESSGFYLKNGGFFNSSTALQSMHQRSTFGQKPVIDFEKLK